jgi:hypothetical protein
MAKAKVPQLLQENGNVSAAPRSLRFHVTAERLEELTIGQIVDAEESQTARAIVEVLTVFVVGDDGEYLPADEARREIRNMTLGQMRETLPMVMAEIKDAAAPNG